MKKLARKVLKKIASIMNEDSDARIQNLVGQTQRINQRLHDYENIIKKLQRPSYQNIDRIEEALLHAEAYQPLYGLEGLGIGSDTVSRSNSRQRAAAVLQALGDDIHGLRVVDVGSSLGYVSSYLADRGAAVEGWDFRAANTEVAKLVNEANKVDNVKFVTKELTLEVLRGIPPGRIDAMVILSVLHHTVMYNGLEYTQDLMCELLDRIPVLIVELAEKGEDKTLEWDASQPEDALAVFDKAKKLGITIEEIGRHETHLSGHKRPLYKIYRDHVSVDNKNFAFDKMSRRAYQGADIPNPRVFYRGPETFIKEYALMRNSADNNKIQLINEINFYISTMKENIPNIPKMLAYELRDTVAYLVLVKIDGALIDETNQLTYDVDIDKIAKELVKPLAALEELNLNHNDVRSWNVIVSRKNVTLIDFGLVSARETENNKIALLWTIYAAITHTRESTEVGKTELPPREAFTFEHTLKLYDAIADNNDITFKELKEIT